MEDFNIRNDKRLATDSVRISLWSVEEPEKFLVVVEADDLDNPKLPGGKFNSITETPVEAAVREVEEEVGVVVELRDPVELQNDDGVSKRYIFSTSIAAGDDVRLSDDVYDLERVVEAMWVSRSDVEKSDWPNRNHILAATQAVA